MDHRRSSSPLVRGALSLFAPLSLLAPPLAAHSPVPGGPARLEVAGGFLEVALDPDRGPALRLVPAGPERWVFEGPTTALVGRSYTIELRNRSPERLEVVVAVDGLNVYAREPVAGRSDLDVGFVLSPWSTSRLPGWQLDDDRARRFLFSPPEWSEGEGRTDPQVGTVTVHVYREWRPPVYRRYLEERSGRLQEPGEERDEAMAERSPAAPRARRVPIGTSSGDDVGHRVRAVWFRAATVYPEASAIIDYGSARPPAWRPPGPLPLGLVLEAARGGSRVVSVVPGSPAAAAGVEVADLIVRVDTVADPSPDAVRRVLDGKGRGDYVFLRVRRGPHELALKIRS